VKLALGILFLWLGAVVLVVAFQGYRNLGGEKAGKYSGAWDFAAQRIYGPVSSRIGEGG